MTARAALQAAAVRTRDQVRAGGSSLLSGLPRRRWTPGQWALRLVVAAGPVLAVLATTGAGNAPRPWLVVLTALLSIGFAAFPESTVGVVVLVLVLAWWGLGLREGLSWWSLVAAVGMLASHLAALIASYGPGEAAVDPATVRRWLWRGTCVLYSAPLLLLLALGLREREPPPGMWLLGLAAALAGVAAGAVAFSRVRAD